MMTGLQPEIILATVIYALLGVLLMIISIIIVEKVFSLNLKKELMEDHNVASGIVLGSAIIAIAIIVASAIH